MKAFRSFLKSLSGFGRNRDGIAAIEFAMIAPVMIVLYFGATELSDAYIVNTRVTRVASTAADLVAQDDSITDNEMANIFNALEQIMFPYDSSETEIVISSLADSGSGVVKVEWSEAQNATPRSVGSTVTVPTGVVDSGGSVIYAEVSHDYSSATGKVIYGTVELTDEFYVRPRRVVKVARE